MRSPFAYTSRPGPLQAASPGAAVAYLGSLVVVGLSMGATLAAWVTARNPATAGLVALGAAVFDPRVKRVVLVALTAALDEMGA